MPRPRIGSIYFSPRRNEWIGKITVGPVGSADVRSVYGRTREEVVEKLGDLSPTSSPASEPRPSYRMKSVAVALIVLQRSKDLGWSENQTARAMAAGMTRSRIQYGVAGPCTYCGDEFADTIDHVVPMSRGGADAPENVVSACWTCNMRKGVKLRDS